MARAETASASARADSIKGLAQSIANPAYRRLLTAEPALRRAVPALIIAFLLTIGVGAVVQVLDHHRQAIAEATHDIDNVADFVSERFDRLAGAEKGDTRRRDLLDARCRRRPRTSAGAFSEQCRRRHHRDRGRRPGRLAPHRRARRKPAAHHPRRQRGRAGNHHRRRQAPSQPSDVEPHPGQLSVYQLRRRARSLALRHHDDRDAPPPPASCC